MTWASHVNFAPHDSVGQDMSWQSIMIQTVRIGSISDHKLTAVTTESNMNLPSISVDAALVTKPPLSQLLVAVFFIVIADTTSEYKVQKSNCLSGSYISSRIEK